MYTALLVVHYLICIFLIIVILLQAGKGAEMGAAFTGASQTIFGSRGPATFFQKLTTVVALVFLLTSVLLAQYARKKPSSVVETVPAPASAPAVPDAQPGGQ